MKIGVIGNSHVGALKRAWDLFSLEDKKEIDLTFFAVGSRGMQDLEPRDGKLIAKTQKLADALIFTSEGKSEIDPLEYDIFLLYGLFAAAHFKENEKFYSKAATQRAMQDLVENQLSFEVLLKLRSITNKKIYVGHNPFKAAENIINMKAHDGYLTGLKELNDKVYNQYNAEIIPQPLETIVNLRSTNPIYTKNSKKLATGKKEDNELHPEQDNFHMNDDYGRLWLIEFINRLKITANRSSLSI